MRFSWVADHFQYLAMIGPIALLVELAHRILRRHWLRVVVALATLGILGALTWHHAGDFRDRETLWTQTVTHNPGAWLAWLDLGNIRAEQGRLAEAEQHYLAALAVKPDYVQALNNLGRLRSGQGRWDEAIALFERAVEIDPARGRCRYNLGVALGRSGRPQRGIAELRRALRSTSAATGEPGWVRLYREEITDPPPGLRHSALGIQLGMVGRWNQAAEQFRLAIDERPDLWDAWVGLGDSMRELNRTEEARTAYRGALRLTPDDPAVRSRLDSLKVK
jgi:Flp pilus assembly protein TadD